MSEELSYIDENGDSVHTAQYLTNRKSCCKTLCLHCPYGTTLAKHGLVFRKVTRLAPELSLANSIIRENESVDTLGSSMIASAFGNKKQTKVSQFNAETFYLISLKDTICGLIRVKGPEVKEIFLKKHFRNQGLDLALVSTIFEEL